MFPDFGWGTIVIQADFPVIKSKKLLLPDLMNKFRGTFHIHGQKLYLCFPKGVIMMNNAGDSFQFWRWYV